MLLKSLVPVAGLLCAALFVPLPAAAAEANVMVIFDASGSMKRPSGDETRITAAKRVIGETLATMPGSVRTGLLTFGHRRAKDCSDIEVVSPIGADDSRTQSRMVQGFNAIGETPIAAALDRAGQSMKAFKGDTNSIVLVTDGIEECSGDPCAAADRLSALGINVKVHVVGFALKPGESSALQCVVQKTGGRYFDAADANALRATLAEVKQMIAEQPKLLPPEPRVTVATKEEPPAPRASKVVFEDKFDGKELAPDWDVLNRRDDRFIVEKGELLLVNPQAAGFEIKDAVNIIRIKHDMPQGDWDIVVRAKLKFQSGSDSFQIGLMTDDKNFLRTSLHWLSGNPCHRLEFDIARVSGGEETKAAKIFTGIACGHQAHFGEEDTFAIVKALEANGVRIVLMKRDRKYSASFEIINWTDAKKRPRKITTDELTSLRVPGKLAVHAGKVDARKPSETAVSIDDVQVIAYE